MHGEDSDSDEDDSNDEEQDMRTQLAQQRCKQLILSCTIPNDKEQDMRTIS